MSDVKGAGRARWVVGTVYLGIPVAFLGLMLWIGSGDWRTAVLPVGMLLLGVVLLRRHRYKPQRWMGVGALFGAIAGLGVTLSPILLGVYWPAFLFLPAMWLGTAIGVGLGRYAERVLVVPFDPALADSPYDLVFRLRGLRFVTVTVAPDAVTIEGRPGLRRSESAEDHRRTYPLSAITGLHEVTLTGLERLKYPISLPLAPIGSAGPAVILQARGEDWVLPTNQAGTLIEVLNRRIEATR